VVAGGAFMAIAALLVLRVQVPKETA